MKKIFFRLPFQSNFVIETDCDALIEKLFLQYGQYATLEECGCEHKFKIIKCGEEYTFASPADSFSTIAPISELDRYIFENNAYDPSVLALHGAAVEWGGECSLFLAATTSGKTTLCTYLTLQGFGFLTDDCILLDRKTLCVHPCAAPIQLRDGGVEVLRRYGVLPDGLTLLEEPPNLRRYVYTPSNAATAPIPLKNIFFIKRCDENRLRDMPTVERMTELMKAPITNYPINADYLRFLSRLAKVNCQRLYYRDMEYVKEVIQNGCTDNA